VNECGARRTVAVHPRSNDQRSFRYSRIAIGASCVETGQGNFSVVGRGRAVVRGRSYNRKRKHMKNEEHENRLQR
jgi:hypothetical protein